MSFIALFIIFSVLPLRNYTNYSLVFDFYVTDSLMYLATNGGVVEFSNVIMNGDSALYAGFKLYASANGLPHNIIYSIWVDNDTVWVVPMNSGLYYKLPQSNVFYRYFVPYAGIKGAKRVRKRGNLIFLQLEKSLLRINLNGNLNPDDDNIFIVSSDSIGVMYVFGDTLYYSHKDTLVIQNVFNSSLKDTVVYPSVITSMDKDEHLVIGTENGIYVGDTEPFEHYPTGRVYSIWIEKDTIFAACSDGAYVISSSMERIDEKSHAFFKFKEKLFTNRITSPSNTYYNGGLYVRENREFLPLYSGIPTNFITTMDVYKRSLFIGSLDWGDRPKYLRSKAFCINTLSDSVFLIDSIGNSTSDAIRIVRTGNGKVFFGAYALSSRGLFVYENGRVEHITDFPTLLFTDISAFKDTFLALWGDGIYRWRGNETSLIYDVNYPSWLSVDNENRLWIGTEASGIVVVDSLGNIIRAINYELPSPAITAMLSMDSLMIVGTNNGLVLFERDFKSYSVLTGYNIRSLAIDKFFRLYVLTDSALYTISTTDYTPRLLLSSPPIIPVSAPNWQIRNVLVVDDDMNMYIGGEEGILVLKLDEPGERESAIKVFPNPAIRGNVITVCAPNYFTISTLNGKKVAQFKDGCHLISTSSLSSGLYIITTSDGKHAKFIIKERK